MSMCFQVCVTASESSLFTASLPQILPAAHICHGLHYRRFPPAHPPWTLARKLQSSPPRSLVVSSDTSLSFSLSVRSVFWEFCVSEYFGRHAPLSHALLCWLQPMLWLYSYDFCTNKKHFLGLPCFATLFTDRMWYDLIRSDRHWTPLYFCSQHVRSWLLLQF